VTSGLRDQLQATLGSSYALETELGGGGMSRVFAATETALGRKVVVKVLPPELAQGVSVERFKREIQLAAQLQHPHIVPVLTAGEMNGVPYYTMPLVSGHSLRTRIAATGALPVTEVIGILRDVAKALACAHENGVIHRDIKPDNVLLSGGVAVVTDFGVAKALSAAKYAVPDGMLTEVGASLGTPAYMAPEQAAADPATDHRADIYAFGVMGYEMLAGHPPFHGRTPQKLLAAQMSETPEPITSPRPDTPPLLAELLMQCLAKEADGRPQSAADLVRVLETVTSGGGHDAMPAILLGGRRKLARGLALYALAFVAAAILSKAATAGIGLPDWVFAGTIIVMALGLPVILFTAFVHHGAHQALTAAALTPGGSRAMHSTLTRLALKASPWVSWRKAATGGFIAMGVFAAGVLAFMILRALGIGPAGSLVAAGKLGTKDKVLVADFRVRGVDSTIGSVITEAVRTDLAQSSVVSVVPPSTVVAALVRMERPETSHVNLTLAREIAARQGIKAIVDGDVAPLGTGWLMTLRLITADSGAALASFRETADSPRDLLPTLDKMTRKLRAKIGESLRDVHASPPLEEVTTGSLEALRKYVAGARANDFEGDYPKAISLLRQAVALDTTFAMAYRKLGTAMRNNDLPLDSVSWAFERAYRYRDRLGERERYLASAAYFGPGGPGRDRAKQAAAWEALLARDSLDDPAMNNFGDLLVSRREFIRAESLYRRAIVSGRAAGFEYAGVVTSRLLQGRVAAAETALLSARAAFPQHTSVTVLDPPVLYARGQLDSTARRLSVLRTEDRDAGNRAWDTRWLGDLSLLRGRLAESERLAGDASAQDQARGVPPQPLALQLDSAWIDVWFREEPKRTVEELDAAMARLPLRSLKHFERPDLRAAALYALAGRPDRARSVVAQYAADVKDSAVIRDREPERHNTLAEIALAEKRYRDAMAEFRLGDRRPDGPVNGCAACLPAYLARAFDLAEMPDSAIAMYERYLATPSFPFAFIPAPRQLDPTYRAGAHKRLGELYEAKGDRQKAISHYLAFVELWKDADPVLAPKVTAVRQRLAHLRSLDQR
jgi:tRNA A-37 threonylcarbamoyl transferase component Bud32/tetratricopeptide (TPR) repeat protein